MAACSSMHCKRVLCIQLQRASVNKFGESVKLQGHISFPMILDLFPFTKDAVRRGMEDLNDNFRMAKVKQYQAPNIRLDHLSLQLDRQMVKCLNGNSEDNFISEEIVGDDSGGPMHQSLHDKHVQAFEGGSCASRHEGVFNPNFTRTPLLSDNKIDRVCAGNSCIYQLVSVVEHFGNTGSGHYTVCRKLRHESDGENSTGRFDSAQWFCASDSKVFSVSEEDVLAAEASLLFYEKIVPQQVPSML